ncbi:hypothetical protein KP509_1Z234100 [Ceratopteris richardii]|nr:hypothetical protein KP509_1Z234100 [Ceratopteris richardii]
MSDKLDKNNFHAWRFRMTNFLMGKGYWKYIEGENENAPQLPERNRTADQLRAYEEWNQGARNVMYWLSVSIHDSMIGNILDAQTPKEAWNSLKLPVPKYVETGDDTSHPIEHTRNIALSMEDGKVKHLPDVLHIPNITKNLVSVGQMVDQGLQVRFNADGLYVEKYQQDGRLVSKGNKVGRMFTLNVKIPEMNATMFAKGAGVIVDIEMWHKRIGHANLQRLKLMQSKEIVHGLPNFKVAEMQKVKVSRDVVFDEMSSFYANAKEGLNLEPNDKENVEKSSAESQVLSGPDASSSNSSNSNPWTNPSNTSKKGKEKLYAEKSLDEELELPSMKTPGVRRAHADDTRRSDPGPRRSGRMRNSLE